MAKCNQTFFPLPVVGQVVLVAKANPSRGGMTICNPNVVAALPGNGAVLFVAFGGALDLNYCVPLLPGEKWLMDFVTPEDEILVFADTANARVITIETPKV